MSDTDVSVGRWPGARDDYRITVTATQRRDRGRKTLELRMFERDATTGAWSVDPGYRRIMDRADDPQTGAVDAMAHTYSRRGARLSRNRNAWPLDTGFDLPIGIGSVIFDALRGAGRHTVDIKDVKDVVSQLGSYITQLGTLTAEQRRHAEHPAPRWRTTPAGICRLPLAVPGRWGWRLHQIDRCSG